MKQVKPFDMMETDGVRKDKFRLVTRSPFYKSFLDVFTSSST